MNVSVAHIAMGGMEMLIIILLTIAVPTLLVIISYRIGYTRGQNKERLRHLERSTSKTS